ncbi:hypothetical protein NQZ68_027685 [Dissostichus eleginoides]|nr:hypothetical protein NQZ68_027685 [Dissostichus eleginoides]
MMMTIQWITVALRDEEQGRGGGAEEASIPPEHGSSQLRSTVSLQRDYEHCQGYSQQREQPPVQPLLGNIL